MCAAFCRGLELLSDLLRLPEAVEILQKSSLSQAVWRLVMQNDLQSFGFQRLRPCSYKALLRWLHLDAVQKAVRDRTVVPKRLLHYMEFLEDVVELDMCREGDVAQARLQVPKPMPVAICFPLPYTSIHSP